MKENVIEQEKSIQLPSHLECPLDAFFVALGRPLLPFFRRLNWTANHLTTVSAIFMLAACPLFLSDWCWMGVLLFYAGYFFDDIDGLYARTYKMTSRFGDYYDHTKDILVYIYLFAVLLLGYPWDASFTTYWLITIPIGVGVYLFLGLQEMYCRQYSQFGMSEFWLMESSLFVISWLGIRDPEPWLKLFRWTGPGHIMAWLAMGPLLLKLKFFA